MDSILDWTWNVFHDCTGVSQHLRKGRSHPILCQQWGNGAGTDLVAFCR